jgi:hypothetical protein
VAEKREQTGGCLCGKVRFRVTQPVGEVGACHCSMCLRWCGGPILAIHSEGPVEFEGEENIVRYRSSEWAERGFCGNCGSNLFYYLIPKGDYILSAGALDDRDGLELVSQIFIDEKPDWYAFANEVETLTGAEMFARVASKEAGGPE